MSKTSLPTWPTRLGDRLPLIIGNTALVIGLWLSLIHLPSPPMSGLDPSWRMAIGYGLEHGWQFGRDIVFTYGPLGFALASTNSGGLHVAHLVWQIGVNLLFALSIWRLGRDYRGWRQTAYYLYFFMLGLVYTDAVHMIVILLFTFGLFRAEVLRRPWLTALLSLGIAVMGLVKFTNLILAIVGIVNVVLLTLWEGRRKDAGIILGSFLIAFLGGWVAAGQSLLNLPAFFVNSLSVSSGYVEAMGIDESLPLFLCGLGSFIALVVYLVLFVQPVSGRPRRTALALVTLAALFLNWKHGFVRADGHVLAHFVICLFFVFTHPVLLQDHEGFRRTKASLLFVAAACSLIGICLNSPVTLLYAGSTLNNRVVDNASNVADLFNLPSKARTQYANAQRMFALPGVKAVVGNATVDVFGNEQAYAILNDLHFTPRPALQGYAAYNERLEKLDGDFMASARAPEFVLQRINGNTIDNRMPSLDDALATRYLYHHYRFVMEERDFLIWRKASADPKLDERTPLSNSRARFGATITAADEGDSPVWCELDLRPSLLGRIRSFFYKPPVVRIAVTDGGGNQATFRLVRGQAKTGFLLYPHFTSNYNVTKYQEGEPGPRIAKFSVEIAPEARKYFEKEFGVSFYRLPVFPRSLKKAGDRPDEVRYRLFNQIPTNVTTPYPPEVMQENGRDVMLTHPPSTLEFAVAATTHHLSGNFGFISRAYEEDHVTDGAEFIIEWIDATDRTRTLFKRFLRPRDVPEDRGEQAFKIELPIGPGRLLMRTTAGPANNIAFDWTYWTDVKFSP